jgi:hypothetical protein
MNFRNVSARTAPDGEQSQVRSRNRAGGPASTERESVAEFEWRYNNRDNADIFGAAIARC